MKKNMKKLMLVLIPAVLLIAAVILVPSGMKRAELRETLTLGERYLAALDYEAAVLAYGRAVEIDPKNAGAWMALADAYAGLGDAAAAEDALRRGFAATASEEIGARLALTGGDVPETSEGYPEEFTEDEFTEEFMFSPDEQALLAQTAALREALLSYLTDPQSTVTPVQLKELYPLEEIYDLNICGSRIYINWLEVNNYLLGEDIEADAERLAEFVRLCPNLYFLDAACCGLSDPTPLTSLKGLRFLYLRENGITDITPLIGMTWLTHFDLSGNPLTDISGIEKMTALEYVGLAAVPVKDLTPLSKLKSLTYLDLGGVTADRTPVAHVPKIFD